MKFDAELIAEWLHAEALAHDNGLELIVQDDTIKVCVHGQPRMSSRTLSNITLFLQGAVFMKELDS